MAKQDTLKGLIKEKGFFWTGCFVLYYLFRRKSLDDFTYLTAKSSIDKENKPLDLPQHSVEENKKLWNEWDWSKKGEEWTIDVKGYKGLDPEVWKNNLIKEVMLKYIKKNSNILEIGPGGGRWTEFLIKLAKNLVIADITEKCLEICKERFSSEKNIEYKLIQKSLEFLEDNSINYIWSYDVFVHINPTDIEKYIKEFSRILVGGGLAIIHHSGEYSNFDDMKKGWRTFMGKDNFARIVNKYGLKMIIQDEESVHKPGDVISIFMKPEI